MQANPVATGAQDAKDAKDAQDAHPSVNEPWLARWSEAPLEPLRPIVDAHHHLWDRSRSPRYMLDDFAADLATGHRVVSTVFIECRSIYRRDGPANLRSVAETEFANGIAAMSSSGDYGPTQVCAALVAQVDLRDGDLSRILDAHRQAAPQRLRGIRQIGARDDAPQVRVSGPVPPAGLFSDPAFRRGFALLAPHALNFEAWVYHPQLHEVAELARAFPGTQIVLNHCGGPIGIGPYQARRQEVMRDWRKGLSEVAACPNVCVKLSGLGMRFAGFRFHDASKPPSSEQLADSWGPYFLACIEAFGAERAMFASNFPVEKASCSYPVLWNAFKRVVAGAGEAEKIQLFSGTAARIYRLEPPRPPAVAADDQPFSINP